MNKVKTRKSLRDNLKTISKSSLNCFQLIKTTLGEISSALKFFLESKEGEIFLSKIHYLLINKHSGTSSDHNHLFTDGKLSVGSHKRQVEILEIKDEIKAVCLHAFDIQLGKFEGGYDKFITYNMYFNKPESGIEICCCNINSGDHAYIHLNDLAQVYLIEQEIEGKNAASMDTLRKRALIPYNSFLVAKIDYKIVGYIETVIWKDAPFETFEVIRDFPSLYNKYGDTLYIIFLAVDENHRNQGIAQKLLESVEIEARKHSTIKKIQLVAKSTLTSYYDKFGFQKIRELPGFLIDKNYSSILMEKELM